MQLHSQATPLKLTPQDWEKLADNTNGYSGSDLATLTLGALFQPIRDLQQASHWIQFPGVCAVGSMLDCASLISLEVLFVSTVFTQRVITFRKKGFLLLFSLIMILIIPVL